MGRISPAVIEEILRGKIAPRSVVAEQAKQLPDSFVQVLCASQLPMVVVVAGDEKTVQLVSNDMKQPDDASFGKFFLKRCDRV